MGYGAHATRTPARGGSGLTDVNIYKLGILGRPERGFEHLILDEIYSFDEYSKKCGRFGDGTDYIGYVVKSFFDELSKDNPVEVKVLGYVATDAVQATYDMLDQDATAEALWTIKAGRKNVNDKSAFGNKIAVKVTTSANVTFTTTSSPGATPTSAVLDDVTNLEIGNYIRFLEGVNDDTEVITAINTTTKTITFAAMAGTYTTAVAISRIDVDLRIAVEDDKGNYEEKERWVYPHALSSTIGIAGEVNDTESGSDYIIMTHNSGNTTADAADQIPANLTTWTPLTSGSDGAIAASDSLYNTLLSTYFTDTDITFLLSPESSSTDHNTNMATWSTDGYKCMYYAQAASGALEASLKNVGSVLRKGITFSMLPSDKWIYVDDLRTDGKKLIPKVGIDAAHWFNTYAKFGESKVSAGNKPEMVLATSGPLDNTNGLVHDDYLGVGDRLIRNYSINICKFTRGVGITNNSARTFSTDNGYKYQNQIMQFLLYKRSIVAYLQSIEQDRAGSNAQNTHYRAVWAYMKRKYDAGHFYIGQKEDGSSTGFSDVVTIVNDFSINTLANIANGIEQMLLQFIAPPPIEEPILLLASAPVTAVKG